MLKQWWSELRATNWRATRPYIAIIAVLVGLSLSLPHDAPYEITDAKSDQTAANQESVWHYAIFWEALATCIIAGLAIGSLYESRHTSKRQLRAYVMVGTATMFNVEPAGFPSARIQIKNFGQTPAYHVRVGISLGFANWPFTDIEWPKFDLKMGKQSERPIAPSDDFPLIHNLGRPITQQQIQSMFEGRWAIWVSGKVAYEDAFGDGHETEFCFFSNRETGIGILAAVEGRNKST